ncbi:MAG: 16S rRNA (cytosine(967)-C(5))-methyltransferase RsmB [Pseudomonadota bacterium]
MSSAKSGARLRAEAAIAIDAVITGGKSLDVALAHAEANIAERDHAILRLLCYGTLRYHWRLQSWIQTLVSRPLKSRDSVINALLAVGLYQIHDTRVPDHAVVSQTVEAARQLRRPKLAPLVNAVLRRFLRDDIAETTPVDEPVQWNHPQWLIDAIRNDWPEDWQAILTANNERAPMWLRVNTQKTDAPRYRDALETAAELFPALPSALRMESPMAVTELPGFGEGEVSVQDGAAQIAAPWLLDGIEGRVLDACAAPGGKSAHLKELAGDRIDLTCIDNDADRLDSVRVTLERLQLDATLAVADASNPKEWWDETPYRAILLDAPCSASGVIRRHPDIKHLRRKGDIRRLADTQMAILQGLWPLLAPGGRLLYVTCSVLEAENDAVVSAFLAATPDAQEVGVLQNNNIRDLMRNKACGFQVLPGSSNLDGFYFACLERKT